MRANYVERQHSRRIHIRAPLLRSSMHPRYLQTLVPVHPYLVAQITRVPGSRNIYRNIGDCGTSQH